MTEASASITGIWQIPQCSSASASYSLTDKSIYPYFFRTVGSVVLYGESLVDWVDSMGWGMFALVYTNDAVGQQVLHAMLEQAQKRKITAMAQIPLYSLTEDQIEGMRITSTLQNKTRSNLFFLVLLFRVFINVRGFRVSCSCTGGFKYQ
jgi:ABC-type branched-subunit amino acid transport system substrate-binding protein